MSNQKYNKDDVLMTVAEYFTQEICEKDLYIPIEMMYDDIVQYALKTYKDVEMPKFSQARKLIISELTEYGLYSAGERFTSSVAYRLKQIYYGDNIIEEALSHEYEISCYTGDIIICTIKLPPTEIMQMLTKGISDKKGKSNIWGKINTISKICTILKKRDPDNILTVIPEFNRMVYLDNRGYINRKVKELDPICTTLCMFVKNNLKGQKLVESMRNLPHSLTESNE